MKIALAMICKASDDEAILLQKCLESVQGHVDGIFIYLNHKDDEKPSEKAKKVAKQYATNYVVEKWTNFGDARNKSFSMVPEDYDFILWLDSDDTVYNPQKLKQVALATPKHIDGVYMGYDYQHDEFGNVTVKHYVARLVRNNGSFRWSSKILHESLEPVRHCGKAINEEVKVIHHADNERRDRSLLRNIEMLELELENEPTPDPRTLYYLGTAYIDAGRLEESRELLESYLRLSGWAEERAQAWMHLATIYEYEENESEVKKCCLHALNENPKDPNPYVMMGKIEMNAKRWGSAVEWLTMALDKKADPMTTVNYSEENKYQSYMFMAECHLNMGGKSLDLAYEFAKKGLDMRPNDVTRGYFEHIEEIVNHREMVKGVVMTLKELEKEEQTEKLIGFISQLPDSIQDNPAILRFKKRHSKPKIWEKNSVVIFIGNSVLGEWGPWSLEEGIGGSEEAVIRLGKQLVKKGYQVTVYSTPGIRAGEYDGVTYQNYWEANLADTFDVFIAWRSPWFFDIKVDARKKYLWLHDVMEKEEFTPERIKNLDKVIVLSEYHRSLFPIIPDEKILLSANGIDPADFEKTDGKFKRDPHKVVYMSSHVRGLQLLYEIWPEVKEAVPEASLDIYYGWNSYDAVNKDNPERMTWKDMMVNWVKELKDVTDHGKVGQDKIVEEIQKSGVWAYPCPFPEISCITAMKSQSGGAIPVSSDFAALDETVQFGNKIHMKEVDPKIPIGQWNKEELKEFKESLIYWLTHPKAQEILRPKMMEWSRKNQSWKNVAEGWIKEFED